MPGRPDPRRMATTVSPKQAERRDTAECGYCALMSYAFDSLAAGGLNKVEGFDRDRLIQQLWILAVVEQEPAKVYAVVREINRLLEETENRLTEEKSNLQRRPIGKHCDWRGKGGSSFSICLPQ